MTMFAKTLREVIARARHRAGRTRERLLEPWVPIGRVVGHDVDEDAQAQRMGIRQQAVRVIECPEHRIDASVIGNVIAPIRHRRHVPGRDPERLDAEVAQVGEMLSDSGDVADPVAITVGKAANVDLVDHGVAPPGGSVGTGIDQFRHYSSHAIAVRDPTRLRSESDGK